MILLISVLYLDKRHFKLFIFKVNIPDLTSSHKLIIIEEYRLTYLRNIFCG